MEAHLRWAVNCTAWNPCKQVKKQPEEVGGAYMPYVSRPGGRSESGHYIYIHMDSIP